MKKILFVIFDFFPSGSAESTILMNIIEKLVDENICIEILTTDSERSNKYRENININGNSVLIHRFLCHRNIDFHSCDISIINKIIWATERIIDKVVMRIGKLFYYPSIVSKFASELKKMDLNTYDAIISVAGFFETFVGVDRALGKNTKICKYIYQLDPIANNSLYPSFTNKSRINFEKRLSQDDCVVFACEMLKKQKLQLCINVDNLCEVEFPGIKPYLNSNSTIIRKTVAYVGSFYKDLRDPIYLFEMFTKLSSDYRLVIAGTGCEEEIRQFLSKCPAETRKRIDYLGKLTKREAEEILKSSEYVVNIGNTDYSFFPSKLFEYINLHKKIINICHDKNCPSISFLEKYPQHVNIILNSNMDNEYDKLYDFIDQQNDDYFILDDSYHQYTSEYVAKRILNKITTINCLVKK